MSWKIEDEKLTIHLKFQSVQELVGFLGTIAPIIDRENHHPDMTISHMELEISLFTYDQQCISPRDYRMADLISELIPDSNRIA